MDISNVLQYAIFLLIVAALVKPVGSYMAHVFSGERTFLDRFLCPIERQMYRLFGISSFEDMDWPRYAGASLMFSLVGTLLLYALLRLQTHLPWFDPVHMITPMTPDLAMNTAVSFSTTTTWQAYGGETTMSYWSQMVGLAAQNFLAGVAGLAVGIAFIRTGNSSIGFSRSALQATTKTHDHWYAAYRDVPLCIHRGGIRAAGRWFELPSGARTGANRRAPADVRRALETANCNRWPTLAVTKLETHSDP